MFKVSAIIITYKRKKKLQSAINSVLNQTLKPYELIIVNNNSYNINLKKKINGINIKVINCFKNFGSVHARNIGVNFSNGNFLAFLDDDDVWDMDYLKIVKKKYYSTKNDVFLSTLYYLNDKTKIYKKFVREDNKTILKKIFTFNPGFGTSNLVISKKKFIKIGGYDENSIPSEDKVLCVELLLNNAKICSTDAKVFYRLSPNQKSLSTNYKHVIKGNKYILQKYDGIITFKNKFFIRNKIYKANYHLKKSSFGIIYLFIGLINLAIFSLIK